MPETFTLSQTRSLADGSTVTETLTINLSDDPAQESQKPYDHESEGDFVQSPQYLTFRYDGAWRTVKDYKIDFDKGLLTAFEWTKNWEASNQVKSYTLTKIEHFNHPDLLIPPASTDHIVSFYYDGLLRQVRNPEIVLGAWNGRDRNSLLAGVEIYRAGEQTGQFKKYLLNKIEASY